MLNPPPGCYLGFDFGMRHIGVAVGQTVSLTASPLTTIFAVNGVPQWIELDKIINQWKPKGLVIGLPSMMDGTEQFTTQAAKNFAALLEQHYNLPTFLRDERLTSKEARRMLFEKGGSKALQEPGAIDRYAAALILEDWLAAEFN